MRMGTGLRVRRNIRRATDRQTRLKEVSMTDPIVDVRRLRSVDDTELAIRTFAAMAEGF